MYLLSESWLYFRLSKAGTFNVFVYLIIKCGNFECVGRSPLSSNGILWNMRTFNALTVLNTHSHVSMEDKLEECGALCIHLDPQG